MLLDAVVIGAGQAGLAASYELQRAGVGHAVLERGRVGETWRSQRWDSFRLNTPAWMNRLPGDPEPAEPDAFLSQAAFVAQLETYVRRFALPVRAGTTVAGVAPASTGEGFTIDVDGTDAGRLHARAVVVASGTQRVPRIPSIAAALPRGILGLPSADYRNPAALPDGAVLVVGSGQSGVQIAEDLLGAGRSVYLCTSRVGRMPRRHRGRDTMAWLVQVGFFDQRPEDLPEPALTRAAQPLVSGVGVRGHTVSLQDLAGRGVTLLGRPTAVAGPRLVLDDSLGANIAFGDERAAEFRRLIDDRLRRLSQPLPPLEDDPADRAHPDPTSVRAPRTLDLKKAGIGCVVWATGVGGDFPWLRVPGALARDGSSVQRDGVSEVPGLYFIGMPWLSRRKSGIVLGVADDAAFLTAHVERHLAGST